MDKQADSTAGGNATRRHSMLTRQRLDELRHQGHKVYGYKKAFCDGHDCCEDCDKVVRFGCKIINKIEALQTKRILAICPKEAEEALKEAQHE